jgi:hypothetical protein
MAFQEELRTILNTSNAYQLTLRGGAIRSDEHYVLLNRMNLMPFQGNWLVGASPGLKPRAQSSCPCGTNARRHSC